MSRALAVLLIAVTYVAEVWVRLAHLRPRRLGVLV